MIVQWAAKPNGGVLEPVGWRVYVLLSGFGSLCAYAAWYATRDQIEYALDLFNRAHGTSYRFRAEPIARAA